nr:serpin B3-like isoform X1 [Biomphalaria glabrata]
MIVLLFIIAAVHAQLASAHLHKLTTASIAFSQKLYQRVAATEPNIVYSPYSIHSALTMMLLGARGDTAAELRKTLRVTSFGRSLHPTYSELISEINSVTEVELKTADAIFVNPYFLVAPHFIQDTYFYYKALTVNIELQATGGPEKHINDFIAGRTRNIIQDVLSPGSIDSNTAMILINTIYFNGTWEQTFNEGRTELEHFNKLDGTLRKVEMMKTDRLVNIKRDKVNKMDVAQLPYRGGRFSLYFVLPHAQDGITELERRLARPKQVKQLFTGLNKTYILLAIPRFKTETTLSLTAPLQDMGILKAFDRNGANFSGMTSSPVYLSQVLHKAVIEVKEKETVAAAATVQIKLLVSAVPVERFIADHPFLYFLRDNQTGQILFQGKFSG